MYSFNNDTPGSVPREWKIDETGGRGAFAQWRIASDPSTSGTNNVIALTKNSNSGGTFNLLVAKAGDFKNVKIKIRVMALGGEEDQGGGPLWRMSDANNYYVARWNPLEENFRVYCVRDGKRRQLASANVTANPSTWHTIEIEHKQNLIEAMFDGKMMFEVRDETFGEGGMVGLWVKADGRTAFDDFEIDTVNDNNR